MASRGAGPLVERLSAIASSKARTVVGLSSGTSSDGVDAALVRITGRFPAIEAELLRFRCFPFPAGVASRIPAARWAAAPEIARLSADLGRIFGEAALKLVREAGLRPGDVSLVGSHGQTAYHEPPEAGKSGVTLQIGDGDLIARITGRVTVSDFRSADVAAGGSGAPLIPIVDWLLFRTPEERRLMLNLGGIANVTLVDAAIADVHAFDTGPANALSDEIVRLATDGRESFDRDGTRALRGAADAAAAEAFLEHPYFASPPPKSTGKELFGAEAARGLARLVTGSPDIEGLRGAELDNVLATAALVTARAVKAAERFLPDFGRVVVSGGGVHNRAIMRHLDALMAPVPVVSLAEIGMDPDAKEAVGFAVLADLAVAGVPGNVPAATGARAPVVLGKLSPGL
jgi:anhydro-N-acetylmuramic acid kinase